MKKTIVLIPFYNESRNVNVIEKLIKHHKNLQMEVKYVFCNDNSSDDTEELLLKLLIKNSSNYEIIRNEQNLGHGGSLLKLSSNEFISEYENVLTLDFDFCYKLEDLNSFYNEVDDNTIVIGKRKFFDEGIFRQIITSVSELTVILKTRSIFQDANCPVRIYPTKIFLEVWNNVPNNALTPNIISTIISLKKNYKIKRIILNKSSFSHPESITWGSNYFLKKIKIMKFSFKSFSQVVKF